MTILTLAMTAVSLTVSIASAQTSANNDTQDTTSQSQGIVLLDAIYYTHLAPSQQWKDLAAELEQGALTKAWVSDNNVAVQPMAYHGGVDWYGDNVYCDDDKRRFKNWLDDNFPADYDGPICLDMEGEWWGTFETSSQNLMDHVMDFYIEGLEYAQSLRPNAKIGYWGLPKKSHTKQNSTTASVERLLKASTGLFPDVYENNPTGNDSVRLQAHIETVIEMVDGQIPVYVQASPRYKIQSGIYNQLHTVEEFIRDQIDSALAAVWTDADGTEHRIAGIAIWDAYCYFYYYNENWHSLDNETRKAMWDELDAYHVELLTQMKISVDATNAVVLTQTNEASQIEEVTTNEVTETIQIQNANKEKSNTNIQKLSVQTVKAKSKSIVTLKRGKKRISLSSRAKWNSAKATWKVASLNR
jgi:hypothetical protein